MFDLRIHSDIKKTVTHFLNLYVRLKGLAQEDFLLAKQRVFLEIAKNIVEGVVYVVYTPGYYKRTKALLNSIRISREQNKLTILQDGQETPAKVAGKYDSYGKYVMMGEGFVAFIGPRNFLDAWIQHFITNAGNYLHEMLRLEISRSKTW